MVSFWVRVREQGERHNEQERARGRQRETDRNTKRQRVQEKEGETEAIIYSLLEAERQGQWFIPRENMYIYTYIHLYIHIFILFLINININMYKKYSRGICPIFRPNPVTFHDFLKNCVVELPLVLWEAPAPWHFFC